MASFEILRFQSHRFFHLAADFMTLWCTKMAIFPTLLSTASLKKAPLSGGASPYSPLWGVPLPPGSRLGSLWGIRRRASQENVVNVDCKLAHLDCISSISTSYSGGCYPLNPPLGYAPAYDPLAGEGRSSAWPWVTLSFRVL